MPSSLFHLAYMDFVLPPGIRFDDREFNAIRWLSFADIPLHRSDPHMGRFIAKLQASRLHLVGTIT